MHGKNLNRMTKKSLINFKNFGKYKTKSDSRDMEKCTTPMITWVSLHFELYLFLHKIFTHCIYSHAIIYFSYTLFLKFCYLPLIESNDGSWKVGTFYQEYN